MPVSYLSVMSTLGSTEEIALPISDFNTTRWTLVFAAADLNNQAAREQFARLYWFPLYVFARKRGNSPEAAEDAVQSFLGRLLTDGSLGQMSQEGGRLRNLLRTSFDHELTDGYRAAHAAKRRPTGGFVYPDGLPPESRLALESVDVRTPEQVYDRLCARALLDAVAERLQREFIAAGQNQLFEHLLACLNADPDRESHAAVAARLGLGEGTLRNKVTAFRASFHRLFRQHIAATLSDPARVDDEIRDLLGALAE